MLRSITCALLLGVFLSLRAGAQDLTTPDAAVRSFMTDLELGDMHEAALCVKGVQITSADLDDIATSMLKSPASFTLRDEKITIDGSKATLSGAFSMMEMPSINHTFFSAEVNLELSNGNWQIAPDLAKLQSTPNPDIINVVSYLLTDPVAYKIGRDRARATSCVSNLKQQGLATMMLIQDYDEKIHLTAATYSKDLMPYIKQEAVFHCPSDSGTSISYSFNTKLAGINVAKINAPAQTVMIYEGKNGKLDFRHEGKAGVCFADGHVKLIDEAAAKKLRWIP